MINRLTAAIVAMVAGVSAMAQDDSEEKQSPAKNWPPKPYPLTRYEAAWSRNPFDLKTVPPPVEIAAVPLESFAQDLAIAGVSQVGEEKALILIDRRSSKYHRITAEPNAEGLRLVSLQNNPDIRKVVARIAKGTEEAEIRYAEPTAKRVQPATQPAQSSGETSGREGESPARSEGESSEATDGR